MKTREVSTSTRPSQITLSILGELFRTHPRPEFSVRLWNGTTWRVDASLPCHFTLVLTHPGALRKMLDPPTPLTMAEAYVYGDVDVEGDVEAACSLADYMNDIAWSVPDKIRLGLRLHSLPRDGSEQVRLFGSAVPSAPRDSRDAASATEPGLPARRIGASRHPAEMHGSLHSEKRDHEAISYHYDTSNEFFALWLDKRMVYSAAYFRTLEDDIDAAQEQKLDYICRKLRLRSGDRLLDIGCGWGGLVMYAARNYGVHVHGVTLSGRQAELAAARIQEAGLAELCKVEVRDYREIDQPSGFDKIVSVGMFEHVGASHLPQYFYQAWRLLRPGGVFLNHGIARNPLDKSRPGTSFTDRYVFPDGELVPIETMLGIAGKSGFEVRDVESLREHYALTLRRWVTRLERNREEAIKATDETTYRIWRLFMAGSAYGFAKGKQNVYQTLLAKPDDGVSGLPLRRSDWYEMG